MLAPPSGRTGQPPRDATCRLNHINMTNSGGRARNLNRPVTVCYGAVVAAVQRSGSALCPISARP